MAAQFKPVAANADGETTPAKGTTQTGKGAGTPNATPSATPSASPVSTPPATGRTSGGSINEQIWGEGGTGYEGYKAQVEKEKANQSQNNTINNGYTSDDIASILEGMGKDPNSANNFSQHGGYVKDGSDGKLPGTGEEGWGSYEGTPRPVAEGTSGADEHFLSDGANEYVQHCKEMYAKATNPEDKAYWHAEAEKTRAHYGYSGGTDGSMYITKGQLDDDPVKAWDFNGSTSGSGAGGSGASGTSGSQSDLKGLLDAWQQAALQQSNGQIDYAVAKAVADLERALADAQPQFKEQAETVAREERQALDNSALYAEMRGDKGGIGQEQYNSIQNTAAQNHLAVQQAQTKLATDTQRQIADLRAQGEFEKADAALQITQQYLQQLIGLEQWAKEYNLSAAQFQESIRQWEAEYNMAMQQFQTGVNQWQQEFNAAQSQWQQQFDYGKQSDLANVGWALLESGIPLSEEQMSAMGIDPGQASQILMQQQLEAALKNNGSGKPVGDDVTMSLTTAKELAKNGIFSEQVLAVLRKNGYDDAALSKIYGYVPETGLPTGGEVPTTDPTVIEEREAFQYIDEKSVIALGLGAISYQQLKKMEADGVILIFDMGDQIGVTWAPGWTKEKYKQRYG